jgi:predicted phosphodiesterase
MRVALIGDTHGYVPALDAVLSACRAASPDIVVHCGDFLSTPFSPDPPSETIALLRAANVSVVVGNGEVYLRDWGTPRWEQTLAQRRQRPDSPDHFLPYVAAGQAELSADDLAWLRTVPEDLTLSGARPNDVYMCHGMPGNVFASIWDTNVFASLWDPGAAYTPDFTPETITAALSRPDVAGADLILCGHTHRLLVQRTALPEGREALVIRGTGIHHYPGDPPEEWWTDYILLTHVGPLSGGYAAWEISRHPLPFRPRDPSWTWDEPSRRTASTSGYSAGASPETPRSV